MERGLKTLLKTWVALAATTMFAAPATAHMPVERGIDLVSVHALREMASGYALSKAAEQEHERLATVRTIVLDPGHGGGNDGAIGVASVHEKYLTMELANDVRAALQAKYPTLRVLLTRHWDREVALADRIAFANEVGADLFISLHYNAAVHDRALGYETYSLNLEAATEVPAPRRKTVDGGKAPLKAGKALDRSVAKAVDATAEKFIEPVAAAAELAGVVQAELAKELEGVNRGVKTANFAVLRGAQMPAVVVESGFLSHPEEGHAVLEPAHRAKIVRALVAAVGAWDEHEKQAAGSVAQLIDPFAAKP